MYIDHKLGLGFGSMVGLILLLVLLSWQNMQALTDLDAKRETLLRMRHELLEARRHEKNFLLRQEPVWAEQARERMDRLAAALQTQRMQPPASDHPFWQETEKEVQGYLERFRRISATTGSRERIEMAEAELVPVARRLHIRLEERIAQLESGREAHMARTERFFAGFVTAAMLVAGLLVFLFTRSIVSSLRIGVEFARKIASGNLKARMPDDIAQDEIGILLQAMRKMGTDLARLEDDNIRAHGAQLALNALLETSLEPLTLKQQLEVALRIVLTIPWLRLEDKGAIFLMDETGKSLRMVASHGLAENVLTVCDRVPVGWCLCGRAAAEGKLLHAGCGDLRHETRLEGMPPHGHYCIPIVSRGQVLGVMTLYLDADHPHVPEEESLLASIAYTLAGILERKRMEERLQHLAHHDLLTALPNRVLFAEHLAHSLAMATRGQERLGVMLIDLDHFKEVNDTLGHAAGDQVLIIATQRIRECLRASDLVARMGGDEFAVILSELPHPEAAGLVAAKIVQSLCQPIPLPERTVRIGASIGIALFPDHGREADPLLACADQAMYRVKEGGRNDFRLFEPPAP